MLYKKTNDSVIRIFMSPRAFDSPQFGNELVPATDQQPFQRLLSLRPLNYGNLYGIASFLQSKGFRAEAHGMGTVGLPDWGSP